MPSKAFAESCRLVCERHNWELLPTGIVVRWGDGRHQLVSLEFFEFEREELVRLRSVIGPVSELRKEQLVSALSANAVLAHGALAIRGDELCVVDTLMLADADAAEIEAAIEYIARTADQYESTIFKSDLY